MAAGGNLLTLVERKESNLSCSICWEVLGDQQVFLPCLHLICVQCLKDFQGLLKEEHTCKVCEERFEINACQQLVVAAGRLQCNKHDKQEVNSYCDTCHIPVCDRCKVELCGEDNSSKSFGKTLSHIIIDSLRSFFSKNARLTNPKDHKILELSEHYQQQVALLTKCFPDVRIAIRILESFKVKLKQRLITIKQEIDSSFKTLIEANHNLQEQLQTRSICLKEEATKLIESDLKTTELQIASLKIHVDYLERLQQYSSLALDDILTQRISTLTKVKLQLKPIASNNLRFLCYKQPKLIDVDNVGQITRDYQDWATISRPSLEFGSIGLGDDQFGSLSGIAQVDDGTLVISDDNKKRFQLFTIQGKFLRNIELQDDIFDVTFSPFDGLLWCATPNGLLAVSLEGKIVHDIKAGNCRGVTILQNGLVITCVLNRFFELCAYSLSNGALVWASRRTSPWPQVCCCLNDKEVVVCDVAKNCLVVLSQFDGRFIRHLANYGILEKPCDVKLIPEKKQLVVAQLNRTSILTLDGILVYQWVAKRSESDCLCSFLAVVLLKDGRIAGVSKDNRVVVF